VNGREPANIVDKADEENGDEVLENETSKV
jgi:hypothetical protein